MPIRLRETAAESLREAAVGDDGTVQLRILAPGWSANGRYYPAEVLRRDGPQVFTEGLHNYVDHAARSEEYDRPERSVRDLAGSLASTARYDDNGPAGPGLYAEAQVRDEYRSLLDDLADDIGVSIVGDGIGEPGERDGRSGTVITALTSAESVDYVTRPAAGGRVLQLIESVRESVTPQLREARNAADWIEVEIHRGVLGLANHMWEAGYLTRDEWESVNAATGQAMNAFRTALIAAQPDLVNRDPLVMPDPTATDVTESRRNPAMPITDAEAQQLREAAATAERERDEARAEAQRHRDAQRLAEATSAVREAVDAVEIPGQFEAVAESIRERARANVQVVRDGEHRIVADALAEAARRAVTSEVEALTTLAEAAGVGPRGAGGGSTDTPVPSKPEDYQSQYGLSESAAKILSTK